MRIEAVTVENLNEYKELILPYIYEEFRGCEDVPESPYFGLAAFSDNDPGNLSRPASVLVIQPEPTGDLNIVSIYTRPECRRQGFGSALLDSAIQVARQMFQWEEGETEDLVIFKTLYRLPEDLQEIYEAFLIKNHFTEFVELDDVISDEAERKDLSALSGTKPSAEPDMEGSGCPTVSASAYISFFREN